MEFPFIFKAPGEIDEPYDIMLSLLQTVCEDAMSADGLISHEGILLYLGYESCGETKGSADRWQLDTLQLLDTSEMLNGESSLVAHPYIHQWL